MTTNDRVQPVKKNIRYSRGAHYPFKQADLVGSGFHHDIAWDFYLFFTL
jgi:hypothetical protein